MASSSRVDAMIAHAPSSCPPSLPRSILHGLITAFSDGCLHVEQAWRFGQPVHSQPHQPPEVAVSQRLARAEMESGLRHNG